MSRARGGESVSAAPRKDRASAEQRSEGAPAAPAGPVASPGLPLFLRQSGERAEGLGSPSFTPAGLRVQRAPADGAASPPPAPASASPSPGPDPAAPDPAADRTPVPGLIVDDATVDLAPGQMRRGDFLALLRGEVCGAAEQALSGTIWSAVGCPYIDRWFGHYAGQSAEHVERALRRYVPEAAGAKTAADYVPLVAARVRSAIAQWSADGGEAPEAAGAEAPSGGGLLSTVAGFFFKARDGGARADSSPLAVRAKLGRGSALDGGVGARMGSALGRDFSSVRVHTDARAASLSAGMNARAFTVGDHVAFAPGEYRPGTPVGDALIAHELAHVAQQQGGGSAAAGGADGAYEEEADRAAVGAVGRIWGGIASIGANALPAMRSGLRLQRCGKSKEQKEIERLGKVQYDHLEEKRRKKEEEAKKAEEEAAKKKGLPPPTVAPTVTIDDIVQEDVAGGKYKKDNPTDKWVKLSGEDKHKWEVDALAAWNSVVASVKGTELEKVVEGKTFSFKPLEALQNGWFAWQKDTNLSVGMGWVANAKQNARNAWPSLAHELGGHFEYGTPYASRIMSAALELMPEAEREKWKVDPLKQDFFETYEYPETEIYGELRERRYSHPESGPVPLHGGSDADLAIPEYLGRLKTGLAPEVAKAVLKVLKQRIDAAPEILPRDKAFFVTQVKATFGYEP